MKRSYRVFTTLAIVTFYCGIAKGEHNCIVKETFDDGG